MAAILSPHSTVLLTCVVTKPAEDRPSVVGVDPVHGSIFNYALLACASVPVSSCRTWACRCRDAQWEKKWTFLKIFFFVWFLVIVTLLAVLLRRCRGGMLFF